MTNALSLKTLIALGVLLILPLSAKAQSTQYQGATKAAIPENPAVHIDLDILELLTAPKKKITKVKVAPEKVNKTANPAPIVAEPNHSKKSRAVKDQEKSLEALEKKYFPERYANKILQRKQSEKKQQELIAEQKRVSHQKKLQMQWNKRRITSRTKMPLPAHKPQENSTAKVTNNKSAAKKTKPKIIDLTAKPVPSKIQHASEPKNLTSKPVKAKPMLNIDSKTPTGTKLVSIAYVDKEININQNVQNALKSNYIPKIIEKRSKYIELHSYASTTNKNETEALKFAKQRAKSLKRFLVNSGVRSDMIEIQAKTTNDNNNFSDWIDIIQQK